MSRSYGDLDASDGYVAQAARPMPARTRSSALARSAWKPNEALPGARRVLDRAVWLGLTLLLAGVGLLYHRAASQAFYAAGVMSWIAAAILFRVSRARALRELTSEHEGRGLSNTAAHERAVATHHDLLAPEPPHDAVGASAFQPHHERFPLA